MTTIGELRPGDCFLFREYVCRVAGLDENNVLACRVLAASDGDWFPTPPGASKMHFAPGTPVKQCRISVVLQ